ncbi:hypothetical protein GUJ93_ZPchr0013g36006 [Zizania palustris]|uniref:Hydrophobic seed protein domain-containing protein n=1 Tax=Zizania palustris TaxID=103762 RepID=A0A8J6BXW7_ZIZPA|nr:hypothetical protein GUJ93_ZPchr0013g36006 [Zizania palustris]
MSPSPTPTPVSLPPPSSPPVVPPTPSSPPTMPPTPPSPPVMPPTPSSPPTITPSSSPAPPPRAQCPVNIVELRGCVTLGISLTLGNGLVPIAGEGCCPRIAGLSGNNASTCLCNVLQVNAGIGLKVNLTKMIDVILRHCNHIVVRSSIICPQ